MVEQGTHEGLLATKGAYYRLVNAQKLSVAAEPAGDPTTSSGSSSSSGGGDDDHAATAGASAEPGLVHVDRVETHASTWSARSEFKYEDVSRKLGLLHCLAIVFYEHRRLWMWFASGVAGCVLGGSICELAAALQSTPGRAD